jgi:hypothetical protein
MTICRTIIRWTLIAGLALGGITLIIGPSRVATAFDTIQDQAGNFVDQYIDVEEARALRTQLHKLAGVYPDRIAEIRGEVARVNTQIVQFEHDSDVARRVVLMTGNDLERLALDVHSAEQSGVQTVSLIAGDEGVNLDIAYREGRRIQEIRGTYQERLVADRRQVEMLMTQQERLSTLLEQIEHEYADYLTASQQETLRGFDAPGDMESLRSIESRLAELSAVQEGTLQSLTEQHRRGEYEHRARVQVQDGAGPDGVTTPTTSPFAEFLPRPRQYDQEVHEVSIASPLLTTPL